MQLWDYKELMMSIDNFNIDKIKEYGQEGWELVESITQHDGATRILVFKRPKQ